MDLRFPILMLVVLFTVHPKFYHLVLQCARKLQKAAGVGERQVHHA
jgi:hypothetical protein